MWAAAPPSRWAFATTCSANVVLPLDSGPKISVTRPRGMPPIPIAASRLIAPVGIASTRTCGESAPIRMMAPLPQVFSIWVMARLSAFLRSSVSLGGSALAAIMGVLDMGSGPPGLKPEYIPKLPLAPSGAKRVRQELQLAVGPLCRVAAQAASHPRQPIGAPTTNVIESALTVPFQCGMRSAECGISRLGRAALHLCFPANLIQLLEPHQQVPGFAAVRGAEDPGLFELVDDTRRPAVADAHAPLQ